MVRITLHPIQSGESYEDSNYAYKLLFTVCNQISPEVCYQNSKPQNPTSKFPLNKKNSLSVTVFN